MIQLKTQLAQQHPALQLYIVTANTNAEIYRGVQDYLATQTFTDRLETLNTLRGLLPVELHNAWSYQTANSECFNVYDSYRNYKEGNTNFQVSQSLEIDEYLAYQDNEPFISQYMNQLPDSVFKQLINVVPVDTLKHRLRRNGSFPARINALASFLTPERLIECNPTKIVAEHFANFTKENISYTEWASTLKTTIETVECASIDKIATYLDPKEWTFEAVAATFEQPRSFYNDTLSEKMMHHFNANYFELYKQRTEQEPDTFFSQENWHLQPAISYDACDKNHINKLFHTIVKNISQSIMVHPSYFMILIDIVKKMAQNRDHNKNNLEKLSGYLFMSHPLQAGLRLLNITVAPSKNHIQYALSNDNKDPTLQHFISPLQIELLKHMVDMESTLTDEQKQTVDAMTGMLIPNNALGIDYIQASEQLAQQIAPLNLQSDSPQM